MRLPKKLRAGGRWRRRASLTWLQKRSAMKACGLPKVPTFCLLSGGSCTIQQYTRIEIPSNPSVFFHLAMSQIPIVRPLAMDVGDARGDSSQMPVFASISRRRWLLSESAKLWTETGKEIEFDVKPGPCVLTYVGTFPFQLKPRNASHADMVHRRRNGVREIDSSGDAALL